MIYLWHALIIVFAFIVMEGVAWSLHKFVMHGFLWSVHKDHHIPHSKKFENNDFFAIVFALPSWLFMMYGIMGGCDYRLYLGIGVTLYGICYMLIHEGLIHRRIKALVNAQHPYFVALRNGHLAHHRKEKNSDYRKEDDMCYGMLWVPFRFFREAWQQKIAKN